jgi:putative heme iron utilization protein
MTEGTEARRYLRRHHAGVLATLSKRLGGYPFGSVVPFVLDHDAQPVVLVSRLAEHTRNMAVDPRASLLVHDAAADVQTAARLTLVGDAEPVPDPAAIAARYLRRFPDAQALLDLGDFGFWRLRTKFVRHIAGFGAIRSITPERFAPPQNRLAEAEAEIVAHMNADHADALRAYCRHATGVEPAGAVLVGIDCDGLDVRADGTVVRIEFDDPVTNTGKAREALAALAQRARSE